MHKKNEQSNDNENLFIMTSKKIDEITEKEKLALPLKRHEKLWFKNLTGVRKSGIKFAMTPDEFDEYVKCKLSVYYFAEKYCKIKLDDGTVGKMKLRDYQMDIIKLYTENRYSILMASRQVGKCMSFITRVLCKNNTTGEIFNTTIGELYYAELIKYRKLNFLEKIKVFLYKLLIKLDNFPILSKSH